ncbi:MAG: EAL domain-containing protein [Ilumatobacter sp.]
MSTPGESAKLLVTSDRLGSDAVANRAFPKVRSWFALGAPLELLSPLSIARILALVAIVTWTIGGITSLWQPVHAAVLGFASVVALLVLRSTRALTDRGCAVTLVGHTAAVAIAVLATANSGRVVVLAPLLTVLSIFVGLFFVSTRLIVAATLPCTVLVATSWATSEGRGGSDAVVVSLFLIGLVAMTAFTARTSRVSGAIDAETGVTNIRGITSDLAERAVDCETIVATVFLSGVTEVREALGHDAGTELVRRAVEDLGQVLPGRASIGRGVGDDLVVLLGNDPQFARTTSSVTAGLVTQIAEAIGTGRYLVGDIEVSLSTHIGIAVATETDRDAGELLRHSSLAARAAQASGKLFNEWDGKSTTLTAEDLAILADLRMAIDRNELWIAYQPQVRPSNGEIVAVEALLRWSSSTHGSIPPGVFIPLAERTGFVDRLTEWVTNEALDAQVRWRAVGIDLSVSVNVSPLSLRSVDFGERVRKALSDRGLAPQTLMLEVTESLAFDIPEAVERLGPLREMGVRVSIDDFGTGYTSLAVLPHLPLDELKVDQQFVREAATSKASEAIVVSVCELAHRLGLEAVAEGVEDQELADLMGSFGYDLLQGYHFARPMAEADLMERVASSEMAAPLASPYQPLVGTIDSHVLETTVRR